MDEEDPEVHHSVETVYTPQAWSAQRVFGIILFFLTTGTYVLLLHLAQKRRERILKQLEQEAALATDDLPRQLHSILVPFDDGVVVAPDSAPYDEEEVHDTKEKAKSHPPEKE